MTEPISFIPSRVKNCAENGHVAGAIDIIDDERGVTQDVLNNAILEEKIYTPVDFSGMGRVVLKKNIVNGVNTLTQEMISDTNTIYVIQYDFTLGEDITVPENCILEFDGGSISASGNNDTITGQNTGIQAGLIKIFNTDVTLAGTWNVAEAYPEWFGAKGDGVSDDTVAIQKTFNYFNVISLRKTKYYISTTLVLPKFTSLYGNGGMLKVGADFVDSLISDVPSKTILFIHGRNNEVSLGAIIDNVKILGNSNSIGIFIGMEGATSLTDVSSSGGYAVVGYKISNIYTYGCEVGIRVQDCWDTTFDNCIFEQNVDTGIYIAGQVINCSFVGCRSYYGTQCVLINSFAYGFGERRPEGCSFVGCIIAAGTTGVKIMHANTFSFSDCIIDLSDTNAVFIQDGSGVFITNSYIFSYKSNQNSTGVYIAAVASESTTSYIIIKGCNIFGYKPVHIGTRQSSVSIESCLLDGSVNSIADDALCWSFFNNIYESDDSKLTISNYYNTDYVMFGNRVRNASGTGNLTPFN